MRDSNCPPPNTHAPAFLIAENEIIRFVKRLKMMQIEPVKLMLNFLTFNIPNIRHYECCDWPEPLWVHPKIWKFWRIQNSSEAWNPSFWHREYLTSSSGNVLLNWVMHALPLHFTPRCISLKGKPNKMIGCNQPAKYTQDNLSFYILSLKDIWAGFHKHILLPDLLLACVDLTPDTNSASREHATSNYT